MLSPRYRPAPSARKAAALASRARRAWLVPLETQALLLAPAWVPPPGAPLAPPPLSVRASQEPERAELLVVLQREHLESPQRKAREQHHRPEPRPALYRRERGRQALIA